MRVLAACLVASGASALVYEVLWLRQLSLVMGHTVYALSAVLTSFFGGLAAGALLGGRLARAGRATLRTYAALEATIGLAALAMPGLFSAAAPVFGLAYRSLGEAFVPYNLVQFAVCAALLAVPTVAMGATLPVASGILLGGRADIARDAGRLYALNSAGGVLGAALAGFVLLPGLGMRLTGLVAGVVNLGIAALVLVAARRAPREAPAVAAAKRAHVAEETRLEGPLPGAALALACYALSGFAALTLEVAWARIVSLSIGSTTYGFTITLVSFIAGLAAGSWLVPRLAVARRRPLATIVVLHAVIALASLLSLPYLGTLPGRVAALFAGGVTPAPVAVLGTQLLLVLATIVVPTLAMGGLFPLVAQVVHRALASAGWSIGTSYAANTAGNIAGSFVAGFVLVPWLGMRGTVVLSAVVSVTVAIGYLAPALLARQAGALAAAAALLVAVSLAAVWAPGWDRELVISAPAFNRMSLAEGRRGPDALVEAIRKRYGELIDYREGATATASVRRTPNALWLQADGVPEAASFPSIQNFIGQLPMLLHGAARQVLVVGLGSGGTLASVLTHPVEHVDCVEISPEVRDLARVHFGPLLGRPLEDPRARLVIGDGRNHLRHGGRRYDVIVSQPSRPWAAGSSSLFTREYFAEMRAHLAPGGVACAWFWGGEERLARSVVRSWREVFPDAYVFAWGGARTVLIGGRDGVVPSAERVARAMEVTAVRDDLARLGLRTPDEVLATVIGRPPDVTRFGDGVPANTDDNAWVEFTSRGGLRVLGDPSPAR